MTVLERSELEASPLADLHAIADQLGLDGFRRLRKAELVAAILGEESPGEHDDAGGEDAAARKDIGDREDAKDPKDTDGGKDEDGRSREDSRARRRRPARSRRTVKDEARQDAPDAEDSPLPSPSSSAAPRGRGPERERPPRRASERSDAVEPARTADGVVELLGNGSAFLRVSPPEPSDEDVYISAAQVRRCELVSGDRVSGPVRTPRRSERYPSLVRIDTINGVSADAVSEGARYEDVAVAYPAERLALGAGDPTLEAIEWLTPLGRGSRAVIVGAPRAGKTETLRRLLNVLSGQEELEITLVLAGVRPEEISEWQEGPLAPAAALTFAASADSQGQAVERAIDAAKRVAARGGHALVLIDTLDGLHPHAARKALVAARNLRDGGSLTVIATATRAFGGETTVIALDAALTSAGRLPALDLLASGTLRPELLVGQDGAEAIAKARADAMSRS
ncbi:MAG TPA: Rho termination factor N-terminal domain-containing protein [Solirubrobacteraceae bacterium]|jgi:transcription termination factor Rho